MRILVTGAGGFIGKNLISALECVRDGRDAARPGLRISEIMACHRDTSPEMLGNYCARADFVFHLAGVNCPEQQEEFMEGNLRFSRVLLDTLKAKGNTCPVMLASSIHASLAGRYGETPYGPSKKAAEELFFAYGEETGAKVLVYRFTNVFGKWCRPNYNSVVATFCHNLARDLPITVHDPDAPLELTYIDDLVEEMLDALEGKEARCGWDGIDRIPGEKYCFVRHTRTTTVGELAENLRCIQRQTKEKRLPAMPEDEYTKKLHSVYISYLPKDNFCLNFSIKSDERGCFLEIIRGFGGGQLGINATKPGKIRGQHFHRKKWEIFIPVAGSGVVRLRKTGTREVLEFTVSDENMQGLRIPPGYTHSIVNTSETGDLVMLIWASEAFDPARPDTWFEEV